MRTLSNSLLAAQKSTVRSPCVKVEVKGRMAGTTRLNWDRLCTGGEPDFFHAAINAGDGSLLRARVGPSDSLLYYQRTASPGPGSDFSTWTSLGAVSDSGIALASSGATVLLFYVGAGSNTVYCRESTNYGQSFGSPVTAAAAGSAVGWLAAAFNSSGTVALFYSVGGAVYAVKREGGVWSAPGGWTNSLASISGLAVVHHGDSNLAASGQDGSGKRGVWTCVCGDGYSVPAGNWSTLNELIGAGVGSAVEFRCPSLDMPDVVRLFFIEKFTDSQSYSRPLKTHSMPNAEFVDNLWREPSPFDLASNYGVAQCHSGDYAWLSTPSGVWRAPVSPETVDISTDIVQVSLREDPFSGKALLELRNDDGRYGGIGSGNLALIRKGAEIAVSPGYYTSEGLEVSDGPTLWITGWRHTSKGGSARLVLEAENGWGLLEGWTARRQLQWAVGQQNIFQLLTFLLARVGLESTVVNASTVLTDSYPAFVIYPGESGSHAVRRLLAMTPDVLFFRNCACLRNPQEADASEYSYGSSHPVVEASYTTLSQRPSRVQVYGSGVMAETFSWPEIDDGLDRVGQVHDLGLDSSSAAQERAEAELHRAAIASDSGEIVVPLNCGQELYDVIDITDAKSGLNEAKRRVLGLTLNYIPAQGKYEHRLRLGGV